MADGLDVCSCDDNENFCSNLSERCLRIKLTDSTRVLIDAGIDVYAIDYRFSKSAEVLNVIATTGNRAFEQCISAGHEESLRDAFESIITGVKRCL